ncbi:MAG TPA: hypothetical protein V6D47_18630 [Oscillatoriaceae cyanobacterium]
MPENRLDPIKRQSYLFSILLAGVAVRVLVGLFRPRLGLDESALVGLTAVVFLAPTLYRVTHGEELLDSRRKRLCHALSMVLSAGLFCFYIV